MKKLSGSTPKSLFEAIVNGLLMGHGTRDPQNIEACVKDFLSQALCVVKLRYSEGMEGYDPSAVDAVRYLESRWGIGQYAPTEDLWSAISDGDVSSVAELLKKAE